MLRVKITNGLSDPLRKLVVSLSSFVFNSLKLASAPLLVALSGPNAGGPPAGVRSPTAFSTEKISFSSFSSSDAAWLLRIA